MIVLSCCIERRDAWSGLASLVWGWMGLFKRVFLLSRVVSFLKMNIDDSGDLLWMHRMSQDCIRAREYGEIAIVYEQPLYTKK